MPRDMNTFRVSPGLISRPSLSEHPRRGARHGRHVSPGLISRPSLSDGELVGIATLFKVSPGLISRPSLSGLHFPLAGDDTARVAGVNLPAFVERPKAWTTWRKTPWCRRG